MPMKKHYLMYRRLENYFYFINKMIFELQLILVNKLLKVVGMFFL